MSRSVIPATLLTFALALTAACAQESSSNPFAVATEDRRQPDEPETPDGVDAVVDAALNDVEAFWEETYPEVYDDSFEPAAELHPYGPDSGPVPCGEPPLTYEEVQANAFYCPEEDMIAWDQVGLIPALSEDFGDFVIGIVFAHEYGHAIQAPFRANVVGDTIMTELQSDCFSGAWTSWIADGNSNEFSVGVEELNRSVAGMLAISDAPGTSADDPWAHGSGFDRIRAFQDGYQNGAESCAEYPDRDLQVVEIPFSTDSEFATGGNMPPDELLPALERNLNVYYERLFEERFEPTWEPIELILPDPDQDEITCDGETFSGEDLEVAAGFCADEQAAVMSLDLVEQLNQIGDFAIGAELARLYAQAMQYQLGVDDEDSKALNLQADCLVGVHAFANFPNGQGSSVFADAVGDDPDSREYLLFLSPGDLDEAVMGFLTFDEAATDEMGTVFERTAALRGGFDGGLDTCASYVDF